MFKSSSTAVKPEDKRERLAGVRVLIADSDIRTAELVRRVLFSFGFRHIFIADNGDDALRMLRSKRCDLLITESQLKDSNGVRLVRTIRGTKDDQHMRRDVPIIMLTAEAEKVDVQKARDAGITEFLVKPFSAKTLSHRIIQVIDHPRVFVEAKGYAGPCRRRKQPIPGDGKERRNAPKVKPVDELSESMFASIPAAITKLESLEEADIYAPNLSLQAQLGPDFTAEEVLDEKVVEEAQQALMAAEEEYVEWAREDIGKLEQAFVELKKRPGDPMAHHILLTAAYSIKAQAGIFGYGIGSDIGKQLVQYLQQNPVMDENRLVVVRKHIDTINVIFNQKIKDSGQLVARELMKGLHDLINKIG